MIHQKKKKKKTLKPMVFGPNGISFLPQMRGAGKDYGSILY